MKHSIKYYSLLLLGFSLLVSVSNVSAQKIKKSKDAPNVIMIYVDDLGYGDISCYGNSLVATPNIDFLAQNGMKFTQHYVMAPVCAPSRVGLMSGSYPTRLGVDANNASNFKMDSGYKLMPEAFKAGGYNVGISGKWNIPVEINSVFDFSRYSINFAANYWPNEAGVYRGVNNSLTPELKNGLWGPEKEGDKYLTDMVFDGAIEFLEKNKTEKKPFFLYVAPNAPHYPMQPHKRYLDKVKHITNPAYQAYAAMVLGLDDDIGKLLDYLKVNKLMDNTIICFASDNGPSKASGATSDEGGAGAKSWFWPHNWPTKLMFYSTNGFKGSKGSLHEGGIRLPLIMYYPKLIKKGSVYEKPVATMDLYPTLCAISGIKIPTATKLDGMDISTFIFGKNNESPHNTLYWKMREQGAVREGDWKLYFDKEGLCLYNMKTDDKEEKNLAAANPDITNRLKKMWDDWYAPYQKVFIKKNQKDNQ